MLCSEPGMRGRRSAFVQVRTMSSRHGGFPQVALRGKNRANSARPPAGRRRVTPAGRAADGRKIGAGVIFAGAFAARRPSCFIIRSAGQRARPRFPGRRAAARPVAELRVAFAAPGSSIWRSSSARRSSVTALKSISACVSNARMRYHGVFRQQLAPVLRAGAFHPARSRPPWVKRLRLGEERVQRDIGELARAAKAAHHGGQLPG